MGGYAVGLAAPPAAWITAYAGAFGRSGARPLPSVVQNTGQLRIVWATVLGTLSVDRPDQEEAVAMVQGHSIQTQRKFYSPNVLQQKGLHASRTVQGLMGFTHASYLRLSPVEAMREPRLRLGTPIPLCAPGTAATRLALAQALSLGWIAQPERGSLVDYVEQVTRQLEALVEHTATGRGSGMAVTLPCPPLYMLDKVYIVAIPLELAFHLKCEDCSGPLWVVEAPILTSPTWSALGLEPSGAFEQMPTGAESIQIFQSDGIVICNDRNCRMLHAVVTKNITVVRSTTAAMAAKLWPWGKDIFLKTK